MKVYQINMSVRRFRCVVHAIFCVSLKRYSTKYMFEWRIEDFVSATLVIFDEKCSSVNKLLKPKGGNMAHVGLGSLPR